MLTQKQKDLLLFIHDRMQKSGVPPSFDEMKDALDLKSKSGIHRLIMALVERGFIRRLPNRARAIEVIKLPENMSIGRSISGGAGAAGSVGLAVGHNSGTAARPQTASAAPRPAFQPSVIEGSKLRPSGPGGDDGGRDFHTPPAVVIDSRTVSIPVMGRIAAGTPISAIQQHSHDIACPPDLLGHGEHFALEVRGDSMIEAGIYDGDTVIIRRCDNAENGDIVVALVEKEEATLKRLRRKGSTVALEAANPEFKTRIFGPDQVDIQGRLVALIRRY